MAIAVLVPVVVLAVFAITQLVERERTLFADRVKSQAEDLMAAVDGRIDSVVAVAQVVAQSRSLERGDLQAFHDQVLRVLQARPDVLTINLATPAGQQVVNALRPYGSPLPRVAPSAVEDFSKVLATRRPVVGNVVLGPVSGRHDFAVRVPVQHNGEVAYVLSVITSAESIGQLLRALPIPEEWTAGIVDGAQCIVARSVSPERVGEPASDALRAAISASRRGWLSGATSLEGVDLYTAHITSPTTGWSAAIGVPRSAFDASARMAMRDMALGVLVALALAAALALFLGRPIVRVFTSLVAIARGIERGEAVPPHAPTRIREADALFEALERAAAAVRERENRQRMAESALRRANRSKDEFLATLSHELRNPLAALVSAVHIMRTAGDRKAALQHACDVAERQAGHMTHLIEDLLDMSRVTMAEPNLKRAPVDLAVAVRRVVSALRTAGRLTHHQVTTRTSAAWVLGDAARIEQILTNLLDNALKYTPDGGTITVRSRKEADIAILEVDDDGMGLPDDLIGRVFDLFVQGERGLDRRGGGLGIGLALVKRLVEAHGGTVSAASDGLGRGSRFSVQLPAIAPPASEAQPEELRRANRSARVLVVEDNEDARRTLVSALSLDGHEVYQAADGFSALEQANKVAPQVALLDIGLPGIDGYRLAAELRARFGPRMMLVAITGYGQADDVQRALDAGFDLHLTKPVSPRRLKEIIATAA